jgi:hypothetical protein
MLVWVQTANCYCSRVNIIGALQQTLENGRRNLLRTSLPRTSRPPARYSDECSFFISNFIILFIFFVFMIYNDTNLLEFHSSPFCRATCSSYTVWDFSDAICCARSARRRPRPQSQMVGFMFYICIYFFSIFCLPLLLLELF